MDDTGRTPRPKAKAARPSSPAPVLRMARDIPRVGRSAAVHYCPRCGLKRRACRCPA